MHGRRKYKVTIRVVDHPPGTTTSSRDTNNVEISEQKTASLGEDNVVSCETKSVYKSCVSLELSNEPNRSTVDKSLCCSATKGDKVRSLETKGTTHNSSLKEGMLNSTCRKEFCECVRTKPLFGSQETASLNIYKLTRYNATIDEECFDQGKANVNLNNTGGRDSPKPVKFITTEKFCSSPSLSSANFRAKHGVYKQRNGLGRHLPCVVVNSVNMDDMSYEQGVLTDTNGIQDGFLPDFDVLGTRTGRPPLTREGSACSSDSIITEIEGLTDEEGELKSCSCEEDDTPCEETAAKSNTNWKKIRGMIHWAPFAKNYKRKYPWVQLAGHQGNFKAGEQGTILKKTNDIEKRCLIHLMKDVLRPYVPEFKREVVNHEESYLVLQDLLFGFESPSVMDCKMGVRTFLEDELEQARKKPKLRKDLFQKMIDVDPDAPTEEERKAGGISKPRYMKWREELSSSASLGFRIEGIKKSGEKPNKDFKTTRSREDLCEKFRNFINNDGMIKVKYIQRLKAIRGVLESSSFFKVHEVIGSSLLFVHDCHGNVNVWMIDFAKTIRVEDSIDLTHRAMWQEGNHEDGYLFGLDNMISIWSDV